MSLIILLLMLFLHIVDDYYLQGILAKMKQKSWWEEHFEKLDYYTSDYIVALIEHAFSWTFMVMTPITVYVLFHEDQILKYLYIVFFIANWAIHSYVDHLKCNVHNIHLTIDQIIHVMQVYITWAFFSMYFNSIG